MTDGREAGHAQRIAEIVSSAVFLLGWPIMYLSGWLDALAW